VILAGGFSLAILFGIFELFGTLEQLLDGSPPGWLRAFLG
jgi:hypothetical protein